MDPTPQQPDNLSLSLQRLTQRFATKPKLPPPSETITTSQREPSPPPLTPQQHQYELLTIHQHPTPQIGKFNYTLKQSYHRRQFRRHRDKNNPHYYTEILPPSTPIHAPSITPPLFHPRPPAPLTIDEAFSHLFQRNELLPFHLRLTDPELSYQVFIWHRYLQLKISTTNLMFSRHPYLFNPHPDITIYHQDRPRLLTKHPRHVPPISFHNYQRYYLRDLETPTRKRKLHLHQIPFAFFTPVWRMWYNKGRLRRTVIFTEPSFLDPQAITYSIQRRHYYRSCITPQTPEIRLQQYLVINHHERVKTSPHKYPHIQIKDVALIAPRPYTRAPHPASPYFPSFQYTRTYDSNTRTTLVTAHNQTDIWVSRPQHQAFIADDSEIFEFKYQNLTIVYQYSPTKPTPHVYLLQVLITDTHENLLPLLRQEEKTHPTHFDQQYEGAYTLNVLRRLALEDAAARTNSPSPYAPDPLLLAQAELVDRLAQDHPEHLSEMIRPLDEPSPTHLRDAARLPRTLEITYYPQAPAPLPPLPKDE